MMIKACSNSQGCVWVGITEAEVVRVGSNPDVGPFLTFSLEEWAEFLQGADRGAFTPEALRAARDGALRA